MLRRLITLFALLSGLAAIGAPVQARAGELPGIGFVATAPMRADCVKKGGERGAERKRPADERGARKEPCRKPAPSIVYFPPVMLQADRARE